MEKPVMIITGASSGIGAAVARRMAGDGYRITLAARRVERLQALAVEVARLGGQPLVVPTDVTARGSLENMLQQTLDCWGQVDILFNNAGVAYDRKFDKMAEERILAEIQTNLVAVIQAAHVVLPVMLRQKSGHIINTASINGLIATPANPIYCATKYGVVGFSDALRRQLRGTGVRVSAFCPGYTPSELHPRLKAHADGKPRAPRIPGLMPTDYVAGQVAALIRRPRRILMIPKLWRPMIFLGNVFPGIADWVIKLF